MQPLGQRTIRNLGTLHNSNSTAGMGLPNLIKTVYVLRGAPTGSGLESVLLSSVLALFGLCSGACRVRQVCSLWGYHGSENDSPGTPKSPRSALTTLKPVMEHSARSAVSDTNGKRQVLGPDELTTFLAETYFPDDWVDADNPYHMKVRRQTNGDRRPPVSSGDQSGMDPSFAPTKIKNEQTAFYSRKAPGINGFTSDIC
ncbi:hypothetical protein EVAR_59256_1 [Eumeta japonica]|uniref:Uncharacterized protein n=1 Tax=Eumeta variegata TaxID=151549 RepID=A0A4C1YN25_EUMVA|nr:hypothetical protein EVAR_59256_1 [Eumeta japonica]